MINERTTRSVERLFPFVLRARAIMVGRESLRRTKSRLHFVLITTDISDASKEEILRDFAHYPVLQQYTSEDLERHFNVRGAKVVGFAKSGLAQSIYAELKAHRINRPLDSPRQPEPSPTPPSERKDQPRPASRRQARR